MVVITHHQRLLDYIVPDRVHVMAGGRIVRSGDKDLALELEEYGYSELGQEGMVDSSVSVGATP
jgi:Fe-S cluster assembly ATP-binding protein